MQVQKIHTLQQSEHISVPCYPMHAGQGEDGEWSVGTVLKEDALNNNAVYQDMMREGRRKGLPVAGRRIISEMEQKIQHLQKKVSMSHSGEQ